MSQFENLFRPIKIGNMEVKNRIVMAPLTVDYANPDETLSDRQIAYYEERAKGGVGLITVEVCTVDENHRYQANSLGLYDDRFIDAHRQLVDRIHAHGAKVQPQLSHTGPESLSPFYKGIPPLGPSVVRTPTTMQVCEEITIEQIQQAVELYGDAAVRAQKAGYDGVELHAAHSYMLIGSFLSTLRNHRQDEYAGRKFEGRIKLLLEVVANIRKKTGPDFPITVRLSGYERDSGGREINDTQRLAPILVEAGVNAFHVSGGVSDTNITMIIPGSELSNGLNVSAARAIRQVVDVPVMAVGRIHTPEFAEEIIAGGSADMVVMGRPLFADPELPNKAQAGDTANIRLCNSCEDCVDTILARIGVHCALNARCGRETEFPLEPAASSKKVLVIGGGPVGMEAARLAAQRGHKVTLCEKNAKLGGRFSLAVQMHRDNPVFLSYLLQQMKNPAIEVRLNCEATPALLKETDPDVVIVATGARAVSLPIPGCEEAHVVSGDTLNEMIADCFASASLGQRITILDSGLVAVELAEFLSRMGKTVSIVSANSRLANEVGKKRRGEESKRLDLAAVSVNTGVEIIEIVAEGVRIRVGGKEHLVQADNILIPDAYVADDSLEKQLQGLAPEIHAVGDCTGFGLVKQGVKQVTELLYKL